MIFSHEHEMKNNETYFRQNALHRFRIPCGTVLGCPGSSHESLVDIINRNADSFFDSKIIEQTRNIFSTSWPMYKLRYRHAVMTAGSFTSLPGTNKLDSLAAASSFKRSA